MTLELQEKNILLCRKIHICNRRKKEKTIADNLLSKKVHKKCFKTKDSNEYINFILSHILSNLGVTDKGLNMFICTERHSLLSTAKLTLMQIELLPYLTHPVKNHVTIYTVMRNFINISKQLEQKYLSVHCEEGVHGIVVYIILKHPTEF